MQPILKHVLGLMALTLAAHANAQAQAQVTMYEHDDFQGRSYTTQRPVNKLDRKDFNDRASSIVVMGDRWEVCEDKSFKGRCVVLRPGRYASFGRMGLNDRVSSMRPIPWNTNVGAERFAPDPAPMYDNRRRNREALYETDVDSVRAVSAVAGQRCWVEHVPAAPQQSRSNVGAALRGGVIGGILGHQVGGGSGKDLATVGGAVAGAAVGSQVGRTNTPMTDGQDIQRCAHAPEQDKAAYWDVTYRFRGMAHRMQMTTPPGPRILVNAQGEPRS